jgi:TldD protein
MFQFPQDLYTDIRIEEQFSTLIRYKKRELQEIKVRKNSGAFIRIYDGERWYYSSSTDMNNLQKAIDELAKMATPNPDIEEQAIVKKYEVNVDQVIRFSENSVDSVTSEEKQKKLEELIQVIDHPTIVHFESAYVDSKMTKSIYSSKGTAVTYDKQTCGIRIGFDLSHGEDKDSGRFSCAKLFFHELVGLENQLLEEINKSVYFVQHAKPVVPGEYTVLFSPEAAGVFTHESFGHKSESDFMVGDESMKEEWALGKHIAKSIVTIIDDGTVAGNGYTPYDDEGTKCRKNFIIKEGLLTGRLHSSQTAALLEENVTGNARAMNFEFEPIVRMTSTYIEKGNRPLKDIIAEMENGIYVDTFKHGSGMSTFTIAPARAYKIEHGKITDPVKVSVVTGSVFDALNEIDALSEEFELLSFVGGGCGKMEQYPLPVGFGGPYTRVNKLKVQ